MERNDVERRIGSMKGVPLEVDSPLDPEGVELFFAKRDDDEDFHKKKKAYHQRIE